MVEKKLKAYYVMSAMSAEIEAACGPNECGMRADNLAFSKYEEKLKANVLWKPAFLLHVDSRFCFAAVVVPRAGC